MALVAVFFFLIPVRDQVQADIDYYKNVAAYDSRGQECDDKDVGRTQVSCKYIEIGLVDGYLSERDRQDPRWPDIEDYWNNTSSYLKFTGLACGRGHDQILAEKNAKSKAFQIVRELTKKFEKQYFTRSLAKAGYRKNDQGFKCTLTANTAGATNTIDPALKTFLRDVFSGDVKTDANETEETAERTVTFDIENNTPFEVNLRFFGQGNRIWPEKGKVFFIKTQGKAHFPLQCHPGEKICYGAWVSNERRWLWGAGRDRSAGCTDCCRVCGGTLKKALVYKDQPTYPVSGVPDAELSNADPPAADQAEMEETSPIKTCSSIYAGASSESYEGMGTGHSGACRALNIGRSACSQIPGSEYQPDRGAGHDVCVFYP